MASTPQPADPAAASLDQSVEADPGAILTKQRSKASPKNALLLLKGLHGLQGGSPGKDEDSGERAPMLPPLQPAVQAAAPLPSMDMQPATGGRRGWRCCCRSKPPPQTELDASADVQGPPAGV